MIMPFFDSVVSFFTTRNSIAVVVSIVALVYLIRWISERRRMARRDTLGSSIISLGSLDPSFFENARRSFGFDFSWLGKKLANDDLLVVNEFSENNLDTIDDNDDDNDDNDVGSISDQNGDIQNNKSRKNINDKGDPTNSKRASKMAEQSRFDVKQTDAPLRYRRKSDTRELNATLDKKSSWRQWSSERPNWSCNKDGMHSWTPAT
mmetsp:Transcript_18368/g.37929  ORF Transcript_18368/g.37929 Transcript_18368/m.37929 type:complete len:206 (+) Transcript_18368:90-707(+)